MIFWKVCFLFLENINFDATGNIVKAGGDDDDDECADGESLSAKCILNNANQPPPPSAPQPKS